MENYQKFYGKKKVLVIGGSGFLGSRVAVALKLLGANVSVADIKKPEVDVGRFYPISLENTKQVKNLISKKFTVIFNFAGISGVTDVNSQLGFKVNCFGTLNLLEAIKQHSPASVVFFSSSRQEYGKVKSLPVNEDQSTNPISHYGKQKLISTQLVQLYSKLYGINTIVFRTSNVFGKFRGQKQNYNIISQWIARAQAGKPLSVFGKGEQQRDFLYIDDFIAGALIACTNKKAYGEIFNIGSGKGISVKQMARLITKQFGGKIIHKSWPHDWEAVETGSYVSDISKARKIINWHPHTDFSSGLKKMS